MNRSFDAAIAALAVRQQTVFSWAQARELGATRRMAQRRLGSGIWLGHAPGVYGLPGMPSSFLRDLWIAHLAVGPGSVGSHEAAAALHRLTGFPRGVVTLTAGRGSHPRVAGAVVHQLNDHASWHLTTIDGLPVTTVARTLVDLASLGRRRRLEIALDDAIAARLVTLPDVGRCLTSIARRGKPGVRLLSTLLDQRGPGYIPPASRLERALFDLLEQGGEPPPRRQFPFPGRMPGEGRVDAAYPDARLVIEVDGRRWHNRTADFARDRDRDNEAARAGWRTLRLLYEDVIGAPEETCRLVRDTRLAQAGGNREPNRFPIASSSTT